MKTARHSGIELYKIFAILFVITHHIVATLTNDNQYIEITNYLINLNEATGNLQQFICSLLYYGGSLGNTMFFIVTSWFFLENKEVKKQKIILMMLDIWVISVVIFTISYGEGVNMPIKMQLRQFFPNTLSNNWYTTCYILFCLLYPYLNLIISRINRIKLLRINIFLFSLYFGIGFIVHYAFFPSSIVIWVVMYFGIAYIKKYLNRLINNIKFNFLMFIIGLIGMITVVCLTNALQINRLLHWNENNPFVFLTALGLFNLLRNINIQNATINYISKMSLYIYIIHENNIIRCYFRPLVWKWIYRKYGYTYLLMWVFLLVICTFMISFFLSAFYRKTIQKITAEICEKSYPFIRNKFKKIETILSNIE